jgi:hypothetical protein
MAKKKGRGGMSKREFRLEVIKARQEGRSNRVGSRQEGRSNRVGSRQSGRSDRSASKYAYMTSAVENGIDPNAWKAQMAKNIVEPIAQAGASVGMAFAGKGGKSATTFSTKDNTYSNVQDNTPSGQKSDTPWLMYGGIALVAWFLMK